mmetsp:Transcript_14760/g.44576  ORF Transcript_14760/g.44576 Transcript_14760/m.44576 type:complete len:214 (-) Transcript_14760:1930-2571(-)
MLPPVRSPWMMSRLWRYDSASASWMAVAMTTARFGSEGGRQVRCMRKNPLSMPLCSVPRSQYSRMIHVSISVMGAGAPRPSKSGWLGSPSSNHSSAQALSEPLAALSPPLCLPTTCPSCSMMAVCLRVLTMPGWSRFRAATASTPAHGLLRFPRPTRRAPLHTLTATAWPLYTPRYTCPKEPLPSRAPSFRPVTGVCAASCCFSPGSAWPSLL